MTSDELRELLRDHIESSDQTLAAIAQAAGYSRAGLHAWLYGRKADISLRTACKVFDAAGIPLAPNKRRLVKTAAK